MMFNTQILLDTLQSQVREMILEADRLRHLPLATLQTQPAPGRWSVAQVMEHLNFYNAHYLPAIDAALQRHHTTPGTTFHPGWLGDYFTKLMQPGENGTIVKKMKAPKKAVPAATPDGHAQVDRFIAYQQQLLELLDRAKQSNLGSIRIPTSLSRLIALKLGDTFRFLIAHQQRHFVQIAAMI